MDKEIIYTTNELELLIGLGYTPEQLSGPGIAHTDVCLRLFRRVTALEARLPKEGGEKEYCQCGQLMCLLKDTGRCVRCHKHPKPGRYF